MDKQKAEDYWNENKKVIGILLGIWAFVSYGMGIFFYAAAPTFTLPGMQIPLGFWFAHQGAMIVFIFIIIVYAVWMDKIDQKYDVNE